MPRRRVDLLVHLRLSDDATGTAAERDALFRIDEAIDKCFGEEYDGNDIGEGEFLIHLVPKRDPDELLREVVQMIPEELLRTGSYAIVRTSGRDEDIERVVPLAGEPRRQPDVKVRKPVSFGMIVGGTCADNKDLDDYLKVVWKRARELPNCSQGSSSLIVIWYIGGDISSPEVQRERVKIEIRTEHVLGSKVEIPREVAASANPATLVAESLVRVLEVSEALVKRRKLGWNTTETRAAVEALTHA
ncbi:MAG TPA: hypothetical protein VND96_02000 [Candidatus Micrarchaeaceae archaeon]|nr:hypothetical protein [Candidatus Micrarchaeaceae archaeon]